MFKNNKKLIFILILVAMAGFLLFSPVLADDNNGVCVYKGTDGVEVTSYSFNKTTCTQKSGTWTPSSNSATPSNSASTPTKALDNPLGPIDVNTFIGRVIKGVLGIVGSLALLMIVYGGFTMLTSGGAEAKITKAKGVIVWAVIGLVVIFLSYAILKAVLGILTTK